MPVRSRILVAAVLALAFRAHAELPSAKVQERYRQILMANPVEGTALDRLWKAYAEAGKTHELVEQFRKEDSFPAKMVLGHLLRRSGDLEGAAAAFRSATAHDSASPLPALALGRALKEQGRIPEAV